MAMNHPFHPDNIPHTVWWAQQHHHPPSAAVEEPLPEKEHMFEKPLTPSDVGKLNRLVIPKQHAEKYFPIGGGSNSGLDSGLLLSFEDESAKCWQFRYSYWNSSQSYVLTKGWSRYVKEKGLDAGDVVVFGRHGDRMFIGCRRRMAAAESGHGSGWAHTSTNVRYPTQGCSYPAPPNSSTTHPYQPHCPHAAGAGLASQTTPSNGNSKVFRLFGVNLECNPNTSDDDVAEQTSHTGPSVSSENETQYQQYYASGHNAYPQNYMEYNLSGDANQMGYHQG